VSETTVIALAPSMIATQANIESIRGEDPSKWVTPEQIADLVCYLCSSSAGSIAGTTVKVYGGV
jgi:NAD(P)-dependent dehydrogenase (short-subunit alcohol dehydrogenase family)